MRIISQPVHEMPVRPVEAPQGIRNRISRDTAPESGCRSPESTESGTRARSVSVTRPSGIANSVGQSATVNAGLNAQKVFHALNGSPAEASLPDANRAYTKSDSLRFRDVPFTMRVV